VEKDFAASYKYLTIAATQGGEKAKANLTQAFVNSAPALPKFSSSESISTPACACCGIVSADQKLYTRVRAMVYCGRELPNGELEGRSQEKVRNLAFVAKSIT
jgi:TPR repeat protein